MTHESIPKHSLTAAVLDGTIPEEVGFCGLERDDVAKLTTAHGQAKVRVRLRTGHADGQTVMTIAELAEWKTLQLPLYRQNRWWTFGDIRDVMPLSVE